MAQYFEVLNPNEGSQDSQRQFFNGQENAGRTQVRYILADESHTQFAAGQQVMVLNHSGGSQQLQGVVIDQRALGNRVYQATNQAQFVTEAGNMNTQQIFYMETNSQPEQPVQAVLEHATIQVPRTNSQPQPIVLNHQMGTSSNSTSSPNRQVMQGALQQRPVLHVRTPVRAEQGVMQRPMGAGGVRAGLSSGVRPPSQSTPIKKPMGVETGGSIQMRLKGTSILQRQQQIQQLQQQQQLSSGPPPLATMQNKVPQLSKQLQMYQQQKQLMQQKQQQDLQQRVQQQGVAQGTQSGAQGVARRPMMVQQGVGTSPAAQFNQPKVQEEELDDHDPTMNQTPGQMVNYKKLLEQRQQIGKNPILARLPSQIKISSSPNTSTATSPPNQTESPNQTSNSNYSQTIEHVVQQGQQQTVATSVASSTTEPNSPNSINAALALVQGQTQKKPRAPPKPKNPLNMPRPGVGARKNQKVTPTTTPTLSNFGPRPAVPQQPGPGPRYVMNQRGFNNSQQPAGLPLTPQSPPAHQQQQQQQSQLPPAVLPSPVQQAPVAQPPAVQNGGQVAPPQNASQMNYVIKPPTPDQPRPQNPLSAFIPSSQIQHIIESVPIPEEFTDSIRMLVFLENGEQRLITFTLPKEACTIQEILEQVSVPFTNETNIQVTEMNSNGINYIVTVGNVVPPVFNPPNAVNNEQQVQKQQQPQRVEAPGMQGDKSLSSAQNTKPNPPFNNLNASPAPPAPVVEPPKPPTPEPPRYIPGKLAVCSYCGYSSEDFNKCCRCLRKLPDNVKTLDAPLKTKEQAQTGTNSQKAPMSILKCNNPPTPNIPSGVSILKTDAAQKGTNTLKKKITKPRLAEPESFVISSDEESDEKPPVRGVSEHILTKLGSSISISPVTKEPSLNDIKKHVRKISAEPVKNYKLSIKCRTVRIGSYRFQPIGDVILDSKCVIIKAPVLENKPEIKTIRIDKGDMVKVLVAYTDGMPVIFYYLNPAAAPLIRDMLNLKKLDNNYYDPVDEKEECYRRITLLPDDDLREYKVLINHMYGGSPNSIMEELTDKEANEILLKACPNPTPIALSAISEVKDILMYPKEGQGRLSISTEDYACLAVDQFLNDIIIDFYLKYLWENLDPEQAKKVHIFSTFFYKRLTTKPGKGHKLKSHPYELDANLSAAEKRHLRVKNWTKKVNLFEKDFIIIPINENSHWFLAIVCFPGLSTPQTFDGKPYKPDPVTKKSKKGAVKKEKPVPLDEPMLSDKDEADSEDSDMESDESEESAAAALAASVAAPAVAAPVAVTKSAKGGPRQPIKQPCILIFDSLAGPSRARVVATLRDYLTCEFKRKMESERVFNRDVIKGSNCKVPQQNNFTDCGLYVLQYVEHFFKDPIKDFNVPIKGIDKWFEEIEVTRKREDLANLIKDLMEENGGDVKVLPDISLPTYKGKIIERPPAPDQDQHNEEETPDDDMFTDIEDSEMSDPFSTSSLNITKSSQENGQLPDTKNMDESSESGGEPSPNGSLVTSPVKPSDSSLSETSDIASTPSSNLKPTLREFPRQTTDKDTLNYLKSKRIVKHKSGVNEGPDFKRSKSDD